MHVGTQLIHDSSQPWLAHQHQSEALDLHSFTESLHSCFQAFFIHISAATVAAAAAAADAAAVDTACLTSSAAVVPALISFISS